MLKSSINPKCQVFGDYSEQVSDTYKLMGSIHLSQGNIERALRAYVMAALTLLLGVANPHSVAECGQLSGTE